jgi:hypothetical protein
MPDNNILNDEDSARYQVSLFWHNRQVWFNLVVLAGTAIAAAIILVLSLYIPVPAPDVFFLPALLVPPIIWQILANIGYAFFRRTDCRRNEMGDYRISVYLYRICCLLFLLLPSLLVLCLYLLRLVRHSHNN